LNSIRPEKIVFVMAKNGDIPAEKKKKTSLQK